MQRRQDLEKLERDDHGLSPLFTGAESVALIRNGKREAAGLSYGWLLPWDPDPTGERTALLRRALLERPYIKALFWDQATLYQPPRNEEEGKAFFRALNVMMDLYASAIGTTCALLPATSQCCSPEDPHPCLYCCGSVLQIKDIPPRPPEYDGMLCLGGVPDGTSEATIREALQRFGEVQICMAPDQDISLFRVKFSAHAAAEQVVIQAPTADGLYDYAFVAYKSTPYDALDSGGEGRGW